MKSTFIFFPALFAALTAAQNNQLLSNLPACAQQCTILLNAQQSCASNQAAYQSCFCQSALLSQLYSSQPVQLCTQCSASDMGAIQSWYKGTCQQGGAPAASNQPTNTPTTTASPPTTNPTTTTPASTGASVVNQLDANNAPSGPWMKTHYKWVIMLIVLIIGLSALAFAFWFLHRRYHRRREAQWGQAVGSTPNISTWGPGQSVHDLGFTSGASANIEKGKTKEQTRGVNEPPPARMKENRLSKS